MPLVACPDCHQSVSTAASYCIHCGRPMAAAPAAPAPPPPPWSPASAPSDPLASSRQVATIIYALQAVAFLYGITALVALIVGYVKRGDAAGTWVESHFRWQIATFWWTVAWVFSVIVAALAMGLTLAGSHPGDGEGVMLFTYAVLIFALLVLAVWNIYRVARGWIRLAAGQPVP